MSTMAKKKLLVTYKNASYDLTEFISNHPGDVSLLKRKNGKSIDASFHSVNHSRAAEYLMREYRINPETDLDESLEHLVDWNSAMVPQISRLGDRYLEWVNLPVDRELRLFESEFLQFFSKTPWYLVPLFWTPVIVFLITDHISSVENLSLQTFSDIITHVTVGIFAWTLLEYNLHRHLFHIDVRRFPRLATMHFFLHGQHHKVPFDKHRLVFPILPAVMVAIVFHWICLLFHYLGFITHPRLVSAGIYLGYLFYDMTHYFIHHGRPTSSYFYKLRRKHTHHHFVNSKLGFGISHTFWDDVRGTEIVLKRLRKAAK